MKILFTRHGESITNTLHIISNHDLPHPLTGKGAPGIYFGAPFLFKDFFFRTKSTGLDANDHSHYGKQELGGHWLQC
jgi:hypothetical protein